MRYILYIFCYLSCHLIASSHIESLYLSLDPLSITQNLAFYQLYPNDTEGQKALQRAWNLLCQGGPISSSPLFLPKLDLQAIISLITKQPSDAPIELSMEQLEIMQKISTSLHNRRLQGANVWTEQELLALPSEEIDLGRALLIYQCAEDPMARKKILDYEASLDLMALQIRARLTSTPSQEEILTQINRFIFQEMRFRYPPHSLDAKHIDLYTFLPSVIDSRRGVCLGVSVLYLCLAQRLNLSLQIITPPGHIYLRYAAEEGPINIETTARGINLPTQNYLGVSTKSLPLRTMKEVIGLVFFNQASIALQNKDYVTTAKLYEKTLLYIPDDPFFQLYLGMSYLFCGKKKEGTALLSSLRSLQLPHCVAKETIPYDYTQGRVDIESLKLIFLSVDETFASLAEKEKLLLKALSKYPKFRAGLLQLATTQLQMGSTAKALTTLTAYHALDPNDATIEYYLAILSLQRLNYPKAWEFLHNAESLTHSQNHFPKALTDLQRQLRISYPDPTLVNTKS